MASGSIEVNDNGVRNWYGGRSTEDKFPGQIKTEGYTKELVFDFDYDDLPDVSEDGAMVITLPADTFVVSSRLHVKTAAAGGTSYVIGLEQEDGTAIDVDGLHTAAQLVTANLTEDAWLVGGGALVGAATGANVGQVVVTATGTFTAGSYRLIVEYILARA